MSTLYIIGHGDSKAQGIGGTFDRLGLPNVVAPGLNGQGYTVVPPATLTGGDGTGGHITTALLAAGIYPPGGGITAFPDTTGTGYINIANVPVLTFSGGGSPTTLATFNSSYAGGYFTQIEKKLIAAGYNVKLINIARGGSGIEDIVPGASWVSEAGIELVKLYGAANCLFYFSTGINNANNGILTASQWGSNAAATLSGYTAKGVKVVANRSCDIAAATVPGMTAAQITASNSLMTQYNATLDTLQTNNPSTFHLITDEQTLCHGHGEWFGDAGTGTNIGVHLNDTGNLAIANDAVPKLQAYIDANFPASAPAAPSTAYNSTPSNEVSTLTGFVPVTPVITAFSGMSTYPNPQVSLTWGAGNWLRILVQMMTVGGAGTLGTFQTVLTIAEAIPGDATSVPTTIVLNNINLPAADAMTFGVQYKFRLIAQGG